MVDHASVTCRTDAAWCLTGVIHLLPCLFKVTPLLRLTQIRYKWILTEWMLPALVYDHSHNEQIQRCIHGLINSLNSTLSDSQSVSLTLQSHLLWNGTPSSSPVALPDTLSPSVYTCTLSLSFLVWNFIQVGNIYGGVPALMGAVKDFYWFFFFFSLSVSSTVSSGGSEVDKRALWIQ